jgi:hypothetical protein
METRKVMKTSSEYAAPDSATTRITLLRAGWDLGPDCDDAGAVLKTELSRSTFHIRHTNSTVVVTFWAIVITKKADHHGLISDELRVIEWYESVASTTINLIAIAMPPR